MIISNFVSVRHKDIEYLIKYIEKLFNFQIALISPKYEII